MKLPSRIKLNILCSLSLFVISPLVAQTIENVRAQVQGEEVIILYDLIGPSDKVYNIGLYTSINNFSDPALLVEGDVGEYILAGSNKQIVWNAKEEVGSFKGDLRWEVRGDEMPSFLQFSNIQSGAKIRRGKSFTVEWEQPPDVNNVQLELFKLNIVARDLGQVENNGQWEWKVPGNIDTGSDYRLRAISGGKVAFSSDFRISPKIPLWIKLSPLFVGAVVGIIVIAGNDSGGGGTGEIVINDPIKPN